MAITSDQVLGALRAVADPARQQSVVDLGFVHNIKIGGGNVGFDLVVSGPGGASRDALRTRCMEAVKAIPGVGHVSVNVSSEVRGRTEGQERRILPGVKNVVAVASGKGGVGKSTTAVNLAVALAATGAKVGILDADIYGPSVPMMLRFDDPPGPLPDNRIKPAVGLGVKIVSMGYFVSREQAAILRGPMVSGYVSQFLAKADWGELDHLIIDYPPGTGDIQLTLSQQAPISGAVITTTPQDISLLDVRRAISMFDTTRVPVLGICETMSYFICDQCDKKHHIFRAGGGARMAREVGVPFLGEVPIDPRVTECGDKGEPITRALPDSPAAAAYTALAKSVSGQLEAINRDRGSYLESFVLEWKR